ncbi:hypothetical protein BJV82DRAFT_671688 [Fennellomyces sp. T-0311]|nr:hypothetical protein BJV82DRAFT_671688 [Fennellomyces sp. T-0311]
MEEIHDPYRRNAERTVQERANSYLPYSNHPPDLTHARTELYLNEEQDASSSSRHPHFSNRLDLHDGPSRSMLSSNTMSLLFKAAPLRKEQTALSLQIVRKKPQRWHILFSIITLLLLTAGLVTFFCWPRTPGLSMDDNAQTVYEPADWGPDSQPFLKATWLVNVTFDNTRNWIPTHINRMELYLVDVLHEDQQFGMATMESVFLSPRTTTLMRILFHINYDAPSVNDPTFRNLYNACGPKKVGTPPDLAVKIQGALHVRGVAWTQHVSATPSTGKFLCPTI